MAAQETAEFTSKQGLWLGLAAIPFAVISVFLGVDQWLDIGLVSYAAIASTIFIQRHLLRRRWFMVFLATMILVHLGVILAFPNDLDRSEFRLLAFADVIGVLALAFGLEKLMSPRK